MRKPDEMEKYQTNKTGIITFGFYTIALLIYSIYLYVTTGGLGIPFIILMVGLVIFWASNLIYKNKMK